MRKLYHKLKRQIIGWYYRWRTQYNHTGEIALCCVAKLENDYIRFFVEYYKNLHFDKIIIYDNNEPDGETFEEVIDDYIQSRFVEIVDFRGKKAPQLEVYQDCYDRFNKEYDWIAFFDCDEFLTFVDGAQDIHLFLNQDIFNTFQVVQFNWMVYGDNEMLDNDGRNVIERFKDPILPYDFKLSYPGFPENCHVKSILRGGLYDIKWTSNAHTPQNDYYLCCNPCGKAVNLLHKQMIDYSKAYIRHYSTKTIGEWVKIKMKRGDVFYLEEDAIRVTSLDVFFRYNKRTEEKIAYAHQLLGY